jgi:hypothetical protein
MGAPAKSPKRLTAVAAAILVVLGALAASAPSQRVEADAEIQLMTAGPGTLTISPAADGPKAECKVDAQEYQGASQETCIQQYESGTRVTLEAVPDNGHSFVGWSDFACRAGSKRCTLNLSTGTRYVAARFSPVTLKIDFNDEHPFGLVKVKPSPSKTCAVNDREPCEYPWGTTVTVTGEYAAEGFFWIGACDGNQEGTLDATSCRLRLTSNEKVGAGFTNVTGIPPPLGSGIAVVVGGSGRGTVTGRVVNGSQTLSCNRTCSISGLSRYDYVRLSAAESKGSRFYRWSNLSRLKTQLVPLSSTNRIQAVFLKK